MKTSVLAFTLIVSVFSSHVWAKDVSLKCDGNKRLQIDDKIIAARPQVELND